MHLVSHIQTADDATCYQFEKNTFRKVLTPTLDI
jgi:hypothetical protein